MFFCKTYNTQNNVFVIYELIIHVYEKSDFLKKIYSYDFYRVFFSYTDPDPRFPKWIRPNYTDPDPKHCLCG